MDDPVPARFVWVRRVLAITAMVIVCVWCFLFGVTWIRGASMEPTLSPGDIIVFRRGSRPGVGDVILFAKADWPGGVVHRVVAAEADGSLQTRGDANEVEDPGVVGGRDVRGVVVAVIPLGKLWGTLLSGVHDVLHSSTNRIMQVDDGEAFGAGAPPGMGPHGLEGSRVRTGRFTPSEAT